MLYEVITIGCAPVYGSSVEGHVVAASDKKDPLVLRPGIDPGIPGRCHLP